MAGGLPATPWHDDPVTLATTRRGPASRAQAAATREALRARLLGPGTADWQAGRLWGWLAPLTVAVIGGFLRFWHLGRPDYLVFDETYYVKQGASLLKWGHERHIKEGLEKPDELWNVGNTDVWGDKPDFVVHPPVGKWMIAGGEYLFGTTNPFGWRFASAVVGTLSILMLGRIARRMFRSTLLGTTAAVLLAVEGQHFVHSRTGLLDVFLMFWALAAFGCIVIDRDQARERLAARIAMQDAGSIRLLDRYGPGLGIRWWRVAAGVCLGLGIGTKWSGLFFAAAFGTASVLWDVGARRAAGSRHWVVTGLVRDGLSGAVQILPVAAVVYLGSWAGWLTSTDGYNRTWAADHPATGLARLVPDTLRSLGDYHRQMWQFNTTLQTPHDYQSHPWSWIVIGRPTAFDYKSFPEGTAVAGQGVCRATECVTAIADLGNPVVRWGGVVAIVVLVALWLLGRDWRAGAVLAGLAGGWLPWFLYDERTIYTFYAVAFVPYVVLALTMALGLLLGPPDASTDRRVTGAAMAGSVVVLAVLAFAFFYPIWADMLIPHSSWVDRMWLPSWI